MVGCVACPEWTNWDRERRTCVSRCWSSAPYFNGTTCISCAEYSREVGRNLPYWTGSKCSDVYPEMTPVNIDNRYRTCADEDPAQPFWDGFQCVPCSEELGGEYFDGSKCVEKCPETTDTGYESSICRTCLEKDPTTPFWNGSEC